MLKKKMEKALNAQVNAELFSAYLYLSMSSYFESRNLPGFANWMLVQAREEVSHGMKIYDYIVERGGRVTLAAIDGPKKEWKSPLDAFQDTLAHEQKVTGLINSLVDLAIAENDHATGSFLKWFVDEQVEEEANAGGLVEQMKLVGDAPGALFMMDRELGRRSPE